MQDFTGLALSTPRLHLRPLHGDDVPALWAIFSDPEVMRYWSTPPWTDPARAQEMVDGDALSLAAGEHLRLGIAARDSAELIGTCSLFAFVPDSQRCEIGYALARAHWGRGLMHEALLALVGFAFGTLALRRLEADIDPRNTASARALERLGFVREGFLRERWRVGEQISDTALYGLLQRDWPAGLAAVAPT